MVFVSIGVPVHSHACAVTPWSHPNTSLCCRVSDFGLSRVTDRTTNGDRDPSETSNFWGTVHYMWVLEQTSGSPCCQKSLLIKHVLCVPCSKSPLAGFMVHGRNICNGPLNWLAVPPGPRPNRSLREELYILAWRVPPSRPHMKAGLD